MPQPLHHLDPDFQAAVLQRVVDEELFLKKLKEEAINFRALEAVRRAFIQCTNTQSWDDAVNKFPAFTSEDRQLQFMQLYFRHSIPEVFQTYCQSAICSQKPTAAGGAVHKVDGVSVAVVRGSLSSGSAQEINDSKYNQSYLQLT